MSTGLNESHGKRDILVKTPKIIRIFFTYFSYTFCLISIENYFVRWFSFNSNFIFRRFLIEKTPFYEVSAFKALFEIWNSVCHFLIQKRSPPIHIDCWCSTGLFFYWIVFVVFDPAFVEKVMSIAINVVWLRSRFWHTQHTFRSRRW